MIYEACTGSYCEAVKAAELKANRIELCDNLLEGGTTPSLGTIKKTVDSIDIPINVIIRPRGGDFIYSNDEKEIMFIDIVECRKLNVNGIVVGALTEEYKVDLEFIGRVKEISDDLEITFHMAFDKILNKKEAIDNLSDIGINRILTKGGEGTALENLDTLRELIEYSKDKIIILPGAGINLENRTFVANKTGATELHGTKIVGNLK